MAAMKYVKLRMDEKKRVGPNVAFRAIESGLCASSFRS